MQTALVGIKPIPTSDADNATPHEAGAVVTVLHHVEHASYGTIGVPKRRYWIQHINIAFAAIDDFDQLHPGTLAAEVRGGSRVVSDEDLLSKLYRSGVECVLNSILAVHYLCEEIEEVADRPVCEGPLRERLAEACRAVELSALVQATGYDEFIQLSSIRDAIEHPKPSTTFANIYEWDRVPFAWMLGGALQRAFRRLELWFRRLADEWTHYLETLPSEERTFTDVTRGAGSGRSFKKPPTA
jgi:hypothetical protein